MPPTSDEVVAFRLLITGRVQGVAYRASTRGEAGRLGLVGTVRNLPDGSVSAVVQGPAAVVQSLIGWCRTGPPSARVTSVEATSIAVDPGLRSFEIVR